MAALLVSLLALLAWQWMRWRRNWTVSLHARAPVVAPWETVEIVAAIAPTVPRDVRYEWKTASGDLESSGERAEFRSGGAGKHEIRVLVRDPTGREQSASLIVRVEAPPAREIPATKAMGHPPSSDVPFEIEDISVEKTAICRGEQSLIRVRPHHRDAAEARWLTPLIGSEQGWEVPYQDFLSPPGVYQIPVRLLAPDRPGVADRPYVEERVFIEIKDCYPPWVLLVEDRVLPSSGAESHEFTLRLRPGLDFDPHHESERDRANAAAQYAWDFGDGAQGTSKEPIIHHDYPAEESRPADDGEQHSYLVRVRALDAAGQELAMGTRTVNVRNQFAALKREGHRVQLITDYSSMPQPGDDLDKALALKLRNIDFAETASLNRGVLHLIGCDGRDKGMRDLRPESFLDDIVVPPRGAVAGRFTWPARDSAGLCHLRAELFGTSQPGGYEVVAYFALTVGRTGLERPVAADQGAVLNHVYQLLGHPNVITARDIERLEDEGKIPRGVLGQRSESPSEKR